MIRAATVRERTGDAAAGSGEPRTLVRAAEMTDWKVGPKCVCITDDC